MNTADQQKYFRAQGGALLLALVSLGACLYSTSPWALLAAGLCTAAAGGLSLVSDKAVLVPRSLLPLVDGLEKDGEVEEKARVDRAAAMMMGIILVLLGSLLTLSGAYLVVMAPFSN